MAEFEHEVTELTLIPSSGGVFEVMVDDDLVYSKKETGRHADMGEVAATIRSRG